ncbi:MAG: hypothetical protein F8N37_12180 [Telmatospirillum sp.]|nr:hypothetical protein [Telmatospirillum sp.]
MTPTICGIPVEHFAVEPTPDELGALVAALPAQEQALTLIALARAIQDQLRAPHRVAARYSTIAFELACLASTSEGTDGIEAVQALAAGIAQAREELREAS